MEYVEERQFVIRLEVRCPFPEDYDGEKDGYAWTEEWDAIARQVVQSVAAQIAAQPGWRVRPANRGRASDEEVSLVVERVNID